MVNHSPSNGRYPKRTLRLHTCFLEMFGGRTSVLGGLIKSFVNDFPDVSTQIYTRFSGREIAQFVGRY